MPQQTSAKTIIDFNTLPIFVLPLYLRHGTWELIRPGLFGLAGRGGAVLRLPAYAVPRCGALQGAIQGTECGHDGSLEDAAGEGSMGIFMVILR